MHVKFVENRLNQVKITLPAAESATEHHHFPCVDVRRTEIASIVKKNVKWFCSGCEQALFSGTTLLSFLNALNLVEKTDLNLSKPTQKVTSTKSSHPKQKPLTIRTSLVNDNDTKLDQVRVVQQETYAQIVGDEKNEFRLVSHKSRRETIAPLDTNFIIYRTCYVSLGYDKDDCEKLGSANARNTSTDELEKLVQPYANLVIMTQSAVTNVLPAITYLFAGAWSDRNGRKPVMLFAIAGSLFHGTVSLIIVLCPSLSPWYLLSGSIPAAIFGRLPQLMMVMVCYVIDNTEEGNRGLRISIVEAIPVLARFLGTLCSSFVFSLGGYALVYGLDIFCNLLSFLYVLFVLTEAVSNSVQQSETSVYSFENISEMLETTFKVRENRGRLVLLTTLLSSTLCVLVGRADGSVIFQFLRQKLKWDLEHFTLFSSASTLLGFVGIAAGIALLHKLLKITELPLMILGVAFYLISALVQGWAYEDWHIYIAGGLKSIYGIFNPMFRSFVSKLISKEEAGKIFSLAVTMDALVAMIAAPLYILIYNRTLNIYSGAFNFVTASVCGFNIILLAAVAKIKSVKLRSSSRPYNMMHEEEESKEDSTSTGGNQDV
ncbi:hypothetical protein Trydic_g19708 [Trypoxylus dichotomus]